MNRKPSLYKKPSPLLLQLMDVYKSSVRLRAFLKKCTPLELESLFVEFKLLFTDSKGRWSEIETMRFSQARLDNPMFFLQQLEVFVEVYEKRRKSLRFFKPFIEKVNRRAYNKLINKSWHPAYYENIKEKTGNMLGLDIDLKEGKDVANFIRDMERLRVEYLDCTTDSFFRLIECNIKTGLGFHSIKHIYYRDRDDYNNIDG